MALISKLDFEIAKIEKDRLIDEELGLDDYDYNDYEIDMRNRLNEYREQRKIDFQYDLALLEIEYNLKRDLEKYKYELSKNR